MAQKKQNGSAGTHRLTLRLSEKDYDRLSYWAEHAGVSMNEFVPMILDRWVDIENGNYELPTLEAARLNQLIDTVLGMSKNMQSLETVVINGFDSLLQLTKGDNYLLAHQEDGEF